MGSLKLYTTGLQILVTVILATVIIILKETHAFWCLYGYIRYKVYQLLTKEAESPYFWLAT